MKTNFIKLVVLFLLQTSVTTLFAQTAPSDFQATPSTSAYQILLTWTNSTDSEENGFVIQKEWDDGYYGHSIEIDIPPHTTSFTDTSVDPNVTYYYSTDDVTIPATVVRQAAPAPVDLTAVPGPFMTIEASFTDNSDMETWYEVQHTSYLPDFSGDPNAFYGKEIVTGGALGSVHTVSLVGRGPYSSWYYYPPSTTVYVRVRAVIKDGTKLIYSDFSPMISAVTNPLPEKPTNFIATAGSDNAMHISWTDNANHEAGFLYARSAGDFDYSTQIIFLPANTTSYVDAGILPNVQYTFKLIAIDMREYTTPRPDLEWLYLVTNLSRNVVTTGMLFKLPPPPTGLQAEGISTTAIDITFNDVGDLASYYDVEMASAYDGPYTPLQDYDGWLFAEANYLVPNTTYYFKVRGVLEIGNNAYFGPYSDVVSASTLPDTTSAPTAPLAKLATFVTPTSFTANWAAVENADHYELDVITINDSTFFHDYESKVVYDTSLAVTGTRASKRYKYQVRAVNSNGTSVNSNSIRVATIKDLTLRTVCSENPQISRRWKIINNNPFSIDVTWHVPNTSQSGTALATPGESFFTTQAVAGVINYTLITWYDDYLNEHSSLKSATYKSCAETMARGATMNDDVEEETFFDVQAYPNPFDDKFSIMISTPDDGDVTDVEIINLQGQRIANSKVTGNSELQVDGTTYPSGLYIIRVLQKNNTSLYKMFKK